MPLAPIVNGAFLSNEIHFGDNIVAGGPFIGLASIPNTTLVTQTYTGLSIAGVGAAQYSVPLGQFPVVVNPGQSAIVQVNFSPTGGSTLATATLGTNTTFAPTLDLKGLNAGIAAAQAFPYFAFPTIKVGLSSTFNLVQISNLSNAIINVTNIAFATGTDFFTVGAPVVPFNIPANGQSTAFGVQFIPTVIGGRNDLLGITAGGVLNQVPYSGIGSTLQSAFSLTGGTQGTLFAVSGNSGVSNPAILIAAPNNLNCEEASSFVKLHDFGIPNREKQLMRIRGHYEDLGVATVTFTAKGKRQGQPDENIQVSVVIGSIAADGWIREFTSEPVPVTAELVQITVSRAGNSGPASLIDYMPEFEPKGEVIGGT